MKRSTKILFTVLALLAVIAPFAAVIGTALVIPSQYSDTFVGVLDEKMERLTSIEEDKIIIVGGSSVAFGIDSALMEEELGMPVVNFGLYAALGTKLMIDLSREGVKEGDIVILAPEISAQTLSLYFSAENTLNAIDDNKELLKYIPSEHYLSLLGGAWRFAKDKLEYWLKDSAPDPEGIYNADSFNEYYDIKAGLCTENVMRRYYDPNTIISFDTDIIDPDFIDYVNEYIAWCEEQGATVYFTWCPMNSAATEEGTDAKALRAFSKYMDDVLDCDVIGALWDTYYGPIMDKAYFYDTNFHLNDTGVRYRSINLINDILSALYPNDSSKYCFLELPEPPELPEVAIRYDDVDENEKYFTYRLELSGAVLTGLTELGKTMTELTIPVGIDGYVVSEIGAGFLEGGSCKTLIIPENSLCETIGNGSLNCGTLTSLYIYKSYDDPGAPGALINPPDTFPPRLTIYVPDVDDYKSGYEWARKNPDGALDNILKNIGK